MNVQSVRALRLAGRADTSRNVPPAMSRPKSRATTRDGALASGVLVERCARPRFRERVLGAKDLAGLRYEDSPLFGAFCHVAFECRDADVPSRFRQVPAEQLTPPLFAGRLGDELVWAAASVVGHRQHAPLRPERHAASGEGGARDVCRGGSTEHEHVDRVLAASAPQMHATMLSAPIASHALRIRGPRPD